MVVKISDSLRARLIGQRREMDKGGMLIKNKGFTRGRFRILPLRDGELPGVEYINFYSKLLKKGTTSPASFGVPCPVMDALNTIYREGSKDDKDAAQEFVRRETQYWIAVIDREDEGTPETPNVRILQAKKTIYQQIVDWLIDEDVGEDITDPKEGRDIVVRREGTGFDDTKWSVVKATDTSPISEDPRMARAWIDLAARFDVRRKFYAIDLEVLTKMYDTLTGESIPEHYLPAINDLIAHGTDAIDNGGDSEESEETVETAEESTDEPVEEAAAEAPEGDGWIGTRVTFDSDGTTVAGEVVGIDKDKGSEGNLLIHEDGTDPKENWSVPPGECQVEQPEPPQPEPAAAPKAKRLAKKSPKPATPAKAAPPAPAAPKAAPAKAASMPRKPGGAAARIGSQLSSRKK